jgi:putative DNA primase/helicase
LLSAEDDTADTLLPRLMAAGADVNKIIRIRSAVETDEDGKHVAKSFTLSQSLGLLDAALKLDPDIRLVVMDPLSAYLGVRNAHSDADVRTVMDPVVDMLEQRKVALIGNAHLNKRSDAQHVMQLITGSGAIVAVARTTYLAAKVDGDLDRYFLKVKANVSKESDSHGLVYRIESATVHDDDGNPIQTSKVVWKGIWTETADQFYQRISRKGKASKKVAAQLWLRNFLSDGPMPARDVQDASEHAEKTLERAAKDLGIEHKRIGFGEGGCWYWFLSEQWAEYEGLLATGIPTEKALAQVIKYPALPKMVNLKVAK